MDGFDRSLAVLIAINRYQNGIQELSTPRADAEALGEVLEQQHGFSIELLKDDEATKPRLRHLLGELKWRLGPRDRVFFYFAGHGVAFPSDDGQKGFILLHDARKDDSTPGESFFPMEELEELLSELPCRHMLVVLDCCFAGAFRWSSTRSVVVPPGRLHRERYNWFIADPAWQAIASAAHNQEAIDIVARQPLGQREDERRNSPFARALVEGLKGAADQATGGIAGDGVITVTELYLYIDTMLRIALQNSHQQQMPLLWPMRKHERGQFVFLVPGRSPEELPAAPELTEDANPWRGLSSYDAGNAELFFGRLRVSEALLNRLTGVTPADIGPTQPAQRFIVVTGPSGIGKSSLVKAGLLSRLPSDISAVVTQPGSEPFTSLATALRSAAWASGAPPDAAILSNDSDTLAAWIRAQGGRKIVLVVDQLEELLTMSSRPRADPAPVAHLTYWKWVDWLPASAPIVSATQQPPTIKKARVPAFGHLGRIPPFRPILSRVSNFLARSRVGKSNSPEVADSYLQLLAEALRDCPNLSIVLTVRVEYEPQFVTRPLGDRWHEAKVFVPQMSHEELRRVIEGPASIRVMRFDPPAMVERLADEVAQMPGALPLLSFALSEMYRNAISRRDTDRTLTLADYAVLRGGVIGALRTRANALLDELDEAHRLTAQRALLRLVSIEGGEYARRRVPLAEFDANSPEEQRRIDCVLHHLDNARLIVRDILDGVPQLELAHDSLIMSWDTLFRWIRDDAALLPDHRHLTSDASAWSLKRGWLSSRLWSGGRRIAILRRLLAHPTVSLNRIERGFARASLLRHWVTRSMLIAVGLSVVAAIPISQNAFDEMSQSRAMNAIQELSERDVAGALDSAISAIEMQPSLRLDFGSSTLAEAAAISTLLALSSRRPAEINREHVAAAVFSRDGTLLATASSDAGIIVRSTRTGEVLKRHPTQSNSSDIMFTGASQTIIIAGYDGLLQTWNMEDNSVQSFASAKGNYQSIAMLPDGTQLAAITQADTGPLLEVWDVASMHRIASASIQNADNVAGFVSAERIAIAGDREFRIIETQTLGIVCSTPTDLTDLQQIMLMSDRASIAILAKASGAPVVAVFDQTCKQTANRPLSPGVVTNGILPSIGRGSISAALRPDGSHVAEIVIDEDELQRRRVLRIDNQQLTPFVYRELNILNMDDVSTCKFLTGHALTGRLSLPPLGGGLFFLSNQPGGDFIDAVKASCASTAADALLASPGKFVVDVDIVEKLGIEGKLTADGALTIAQNGHLTRFPISLSTPQYAKLYIDRAGNNAYVAEPKALYTVNLRSGSSTQEPLTEAISVLDTDASSGQLISVQAGGSIRLIGPSPRPVQTFVHRSQRSGGHVLQSVISDARLTQGGSKTIYAAHDGTLNELDNETLTARKISVPALDTSSDDIDRRLFLLRLDSTGRFALTASQRTVVIVDLKTERQTCVLQFSESQGVTEALFAASGPLAFVSAGEKTSVIDWSLCRTLGTLIPFEVQKLLPDPMHRGVAYLRHGAFVHGDFLIRLDHRNSIDDLLVALRNVRRPMTSIPGHRKPS